MSSFFVSALFFGYFCLCSVLRNLPELLVVIIHVIFRKGIEMLVLLRQYKKTRKGFWPSIWHAATGNVLVLPQLLLITCKCTPNSVV